MAARTSPDGSVVDLVVKLNERPDADAVNKAIKDAAEGNMKGVLQYCDEPVVSSDIIGNPHSSVFDSLVTQAKGDGYVRVLSWYDNEWGYSNRCVDIIRKAHALG